MKTFITTLILHIATICAWAAPQAPPLKPEEIFELGIEELMEIEIYTELATKTKLDADLAPGMITVLKGDYLQKRGARTVGEALNLVPGLFFATSGSGGSNPAMRGIPNGGSRKIKAMLNGVPLNATQGGEAVPVYFIPIEQVERIEVIRGPGSVLYGQWAYFGVINVVTRKEDNRVFGRMGSFNAHAAGIIASYNDVKKDFKASLNIAGWERDRSGVESGPDIFTGSGLPSNAPGPVNDSREAPTGIMSLEYKDLSLITQWTSTSFGSHYGLSGPLPPLDDQRLQTERTWMVEMGWDREISKFLQLKLTAGLRQYLWDSGKIWLYPPGVITPDDTVGNSHYEERAAYGSMNLHWKEWERHQLLFGVEYEHVAMGDTWLDANYDPVTFAPLTYQRFGGEKNWIEEDKSRGIFGIYIQDQFKVTDHLTLSAGLRYDSYQDNGNSNNNSTLRVAGVYRLDEHHILKAQYSEAFRPPSFGEMYVKNTPSVLGNIQLKFETVKTYELEYIYKNSPFIGRFTLFRSEMNDLINYAQNPTSGMFMPTNTDSIKSHGGELELSLKIFEYFLLDANVSYANIEGGKKIFGAINWLGNVGLVYQPSDDWFAAMSYRYIGKRDRIKSDPRPKLDDYHTIDITAGIKNLYWDGLALRAGIKNIFDEGVRFPAPMSFPEDAPQPGREWWVQVSYDFD